MIAAVEYYRRRGVRPTVVVKAGVVRRLGVPAGVRPFAVVVPDRDGAGEHANDDRFTMTHDSYSPL